MAETNITLDAEQIKQLRETVNHALRRCVVDPNFRWYLVGTETMERLVQSYALLFDRNAADCRAELESEMAARSYDEIGWPRGEMLEAKLSAVREWLTNYGSWSPHDAATAEELQELKKIIA